MGFASLSLSWKKGPKMAGVAVLTLASQERWYLPAWIVGTDVGVLQDSHLSNVFFVVKPSKIIFLI